MARKRSKELQQFYDDVLITFTEGGIQMIGEVLGTTHAIDRRDDLDIEPYETVMVKYRDDPKEYEVTSDSIATAFTRMQNGEVEYLAEESRKRLLAARRELDAGAIDSVDATNIVEIALFGKVVYN